MPVGAFIGLAEALLAFDLDVVEAVRQIEAFNLGPLDVGSSVGHQAEKNAALLE
jgi:hypothetical protein